MSAQERTGLVTRRTADRCAAGVFVAILIGSVAFLVGVLSETLPTTTRTIRTTNEVVTDAKVGRRTYTTETTTADVPVSVWERLLGRRTSLVLILAGSLLAAFLAAAAVQRVLLGHYAFSLGPLAVPDITADQFSEAAEATLAATPAAPAGAPTAVAPEPVWATVDDPNLALAGWRIELEQELRRMAEQNGLPAEGQGAGQLLRMLMRREIIDPRVAPGLMELLGLANRAVHGASVEPSVVAVLRTEGLDVLRYLRSLGHGN